MYSLFFDGCAKGNPGKCGAGAVLYKDDQEIWAGSKFFGKNTNNYAEYGGLILGLEKAFELEIKDLNVYGDSMLVIKQMRGEYKVNAPNLKDLYTRAKAISRTMNIKFEHVYRENNVRADELSNLAI